MRGMGNIIAKYGGGPVLIPSAPPVLNCLLFSTHRRGEWRGETVDRMGEEAHAPSCDAAPGGTTSGTPLSKATTIARSLNASHSPLPCD